jgi:hypothetical protein
VCCSVPPGLVEKGTLRPRDWSPVLPDPSLISTYPYQKASCKFVAAAAWLANNILEPSQPVHGRQGGNDKPSAGEFYNRGFISSIFITEISSLS